MLHCRQSFASRTLSSWYCSHWQYKLKTTSLFKSPQCCQWDKRIQCVVFGSVIKPQLYARIYVELWVFFNFCRIVSYSSTLLLSFPCLFIVISGASSSPSVSLNPCSVFVLCSVIVPCAINIRLPSHHAPALLSSSWPVIVPVLFIGSSALSHPHALSSYPVLSSSSCSFLAFLFSHHSSALLQFHCSVIVALLYHRPPTLSSSPCFIIVFLLCDGPPALSSSPVLSPWLIIAPCSVIVPLLYNCPPALSSSPCFIIVPLLCHSHPALSFSPCSVIAPLLCHRPLPLSLSPCTVIVPLLCHLPPALSSSPCSVIVPVLCHCPPALSSSPCFIIVPLFYHRCPALSLSPALSSAPCSLIAPRNLFKQS